MLTIGMLMAFTFNVSAGSAAKYSQKYMLHNTVVIEDRGGQSVAPYMPHQESKVNSRPSRFPIITSSLTVGRVTAGEATEVPFQMVSRPLFIVGYDPVSIDWLKKNKSLLIEKRAMGLVVNVANRGQMQELNALVDNKVLLQPTSGTSISKNLNIKHYPFYMSNKGVMR